MKSSSHNPLDDLIDEALASYSDAEPLRGLDERVLHRVGAAAVRRRRSSILAWVSALAVAAFVLVLALRDNAEEAPYVAQSRPPAARSVPVSSTVRIDEPQSAKPSPRRFQKPVRGVATSESLPKEPVFPAFVPLTEGENALVAFVRRDPEQALEVYNGLQSGTIQEIRIPEIVIPPLTSEEIQ